MRVSIRDEKPQDEEGIFAVVDQAFETPAEAQLVRDLRPIVSPWISMVACKGKRVVAHILFTPVKVGLTGMAMALGPMAVAPDFQGQGVGSKLVRAGLTKCRRRGHGVIFVLGHTEFYPRFGFRSAAPLGFRYGNAELDRYFMVLELLPGALRGLSGSVRYHPEFDRF